MRSRLLHHWTPVLATVLALGLTSACGGSDASDKAAADAATEAAKARVAGNPALAALVAAAKKEGALDLNWGLHGRDAAKTLTDTFNKAYGINIKVTLTPDQNMPGNAAKLTQQYKAKSPSSTDAFMGNAELTLGAGPKGTDALEKVDWEKIAPWTKGLATSDGVALTMLDQLSGFTYNTNLISEDELPKTALDVLKLKKPVASTPYAAQFNVLGVKEAMGMDGVKSYLKSFKPAGYFGCGELSRLASGEFAALWISCGKNLAEVYADQGAPLKTAILKDAAVISPWYMSVPKNARHPNAAKLWASWLTTPEAQALLFKQEFADSSKVAGSRTGKQIAEYRAQGVRFTEVSYEFAAAHPELYNPKFKGELIKLLTAK
ncbi:ABC transporter substrate-binding protein [Thermomonospora umbrina]|uniref:ABC-type Fe3+ transport system substrate-binding protein n=1 Tax=Thermomonospora umbrina TaxID=111806 RepID=A0A3D9SIC6_9ACTN|nr:ABC transporter substrate-binding protein [Thermomonospora umbrina]REE95669.1 ABC-type Fe3+ transport system substrate-binding protein [Thermomonospora umbrina]